MKTRFKNWITSIIGIIIMLGSITWKTLSAYGGIPEDNAISNLDFFILLGVGWIFLSAKDTLIEGLLGNFIKIKKADENESD